MQGLYVIGLEVVLRASLYVDDAEQVIFIQQWYTKR